MSLRDHSCVPCEEGAPTVTPAELVKYRQEVPLWEVYDGDTKIKREFELPNFRGAVDFVNKIADLAESEGHHPNIYLYDFKKVRVELWTHKIGGLHRNDFVMAAKIDELK